MNFNRLVGIILFISLGFLKTEITLTVNDHSSEYMYDREVYVSTK